MLISRWTFPVTSLLSGPITSDHLHIHTHSCQFQLSCNCSDTTNLLLGFTFAKPLFSKIDILISAVLIHFKGPSFCLTFPFAGSLSPDSPILQQSIPESLRSLRLRGFINLRNQLKFKFSISSPICVSGHLLTTPDPHSIVTQLLQPHDYRSSCPISVSDINWLIVTSTQIFLDQPSLLHLGTPLIVVGDLHGNYFDLIRIFMRYGFPDVSNYLFLGDLVDRGKNGVDILILLCCFKLMYPKKLFVVRGNHECERITAHKGFKVECELKKVPYRSFLVLFRSLPLAAIVGEKILCVHGGISPTLTSFREIEAFQRPADVLNCTAMNDLLWADPRVDIKHFCFNAGRTTSFQFGAKALLKFLIQFKLELLVRAHEVVPDGFAWPFGQAIPMMTIFSATNNKGGNAASVLLIDDQLTCAIDTFSSMTAAEKDKMNTLDFNEYRKER